MENIKLRVSHIGEKISKNIQSLAKPRSSTVCRLCGNFQVKPGVATLNSEQLIRSAKHGCSTCKILDTAITLFYEWKDVDFVNIACHNGRMSLAVTGQRSPNKPSDYDGTTFPPRHVLELAVAQGC
jgi:hypothetical protein